MAVNQTSANDKIAEFQKNGSIAMAISKDGKLSVKNGSNQSMGTVTLVAGAAVINNTLITAGSNIFTSKQNGASVGSVRVSSRVAGVSFTLTSSDAADTSPIAWWIVEPE